MKQFSDILDQRIFSKGDICRLLVSTETDGHQQLIDKAYDVKTSVVGKKTYLRGLIELSNICRKNCLYCGIRASNKLITRFHASDDEVIRMAVFAWKNNYSSIVLQTGEVMSSAFSSKIESLILKIHKETNQELRITLSCGEQTDDTYNRWFNAGAKRYLLRIETSSGELYKKIHPDDSLHSFDNRLKCLHSLKNIGYQVGSGVMIGLPFQTIEQLADDIIFFKEFDIDMVGMGPYVTHEQTPLSEIRDLLPLQERYNLSLRMIAVLRIVMPEINIASATALQAIEPKGRIEGLRAGANVIMPNLTPADYKKYYQLYDNKPCLGDTAIVCNACISGQIQYFGEEVAYGQQGDSIHYIRKQK